MDRVYDHGDHDRLHRCLSEFDFRYQCRKETGFIRTVHVMDEHYTKAADAPGPKSTRLKGKKRDFKSSKAAKGQLAG